MRITHQLTARNKLTYYYVHPQNNFSRALGTGYGLVSGNALFVGDAYPTYMANVHGRRR